MTVAAIVVLAFMLVGVILVVQARSGVGFSLPEFYAAGKDAGFSLRQIRLLHRVARETRLLNPSSLFWSQRSLDRCIEKIYMRFYRDGLEDVPGNAAFLDQLFAYRKTVALNQPHVRFGIQSSRNLDVGQPLTIVIERGGTFRSRITENTRTHLSIAYPAGKVLPRGFSWRGKGVRVVLRRRGDAAYTFTSKITGNYLNRPRPVLYIEHAERMEREQKRRSVRGPLNAPGRVLPVRAPEDVDFTPTGAGGYRCRMVDISEDGAALKVGGRAKAGIHLRVETQIDEHPVVLSGTVRKATYDEKRHLTLLHLQAEVADIVMKNRIRAYVFGIGRPDASSLQRGTADAVRTEQEASAVAVRTDETAEGAEGTEEL